MKQRLIDAQYTYVIRSVLIGLLCVLYVYNVPPTHVIAKLGAVILLSGFVYSVTERLLSTRSRFLCALGFAGVLFLQFISMLTLFHVIVWLGIIVCLALLTKQS